MAEIALTPSISERLAWTDNLFLKELQAMELRSEPVLDFKYSGDQATLSLLGKLINYRYWDTANNTLSRQDFDTDNYNRTTYEVRPNIAYQATERLNLTVGGGWLRDYSVDTFWDLDQDMRNLLRRDTYSANAGFSYHFTEKDTVSANITYATLAYDERIPNFSDYNMTVANLTWNRPILDGTMALLAQVSWQHAEFDAPEYTNFIFSTKQDTTQDVYGGMAGLHWAPSERLTLQVMAGANYTRSKLKNEDTFSYGGFSSSTTTTTRNSKSGFTGMGSLVWREQDSMLSFNVKQEFLPSSYGELRKSTSAALRHRFSYSQRLNISSGLSYTRSKSEDVRTYNIDKAFWRFSVQPQYKLTEDIYVRMGYVFLYYDNKAANYRRRSNTAFLQIAYEFPLTFQ